MDGRRDTPQNHPQHFSQVRSALRFAMVSASASMKGLKGGPRAGVCFGRLSLAAHISTMCLAEHAPRGVCAYRAAIVDS